MSAELDLLRNNPPKTLDDVDPWMANYLRVCEEERANALALDRLHDAAPALRDALLLMVNVFGPGVDAFGDGAGSGEIEAVTAAREALAMARGE